LRYKKLYSIRRTRENTD